MPISEGEAGRVRTGYESVMAHRVSSDFAGTATKNGVASVDEDARIITVNYDDGTKDVFPFGEEYTNVSGLYITQDLVANVTDGQKIKRGDVMTYNKGFFEHDPTTGQVAWKHGVHGNIMIAEFGSTLEDSNVITKELSQKLTMKPVHQRTVTLPVDTVIHRIVGEGDEVLNTDPLLVFEEGDPGELAILNTDDQDLIDTLSEINSRTPKAKHTGKIVKIEVFYNRELSELHPSLAKVVKKSIKLKNKRNKIAKGSDSEFKYPESKPLPKGAKYKGVSFDSDMVVIQFYIQEELASGVGDKLVFDSSLKSVTADVLEHSPETVSGVKIDGIFSGRSINNRIIMSPILNGLSERVMEKLEDAVVDVFFEE